MINYENYETNELLAAVKSGDDDACAELLRRYTPLIDSVVYNTMPLLSVTSRAEEDELRQEAAIKLYQAALAYDEEREDTTFGLYAKICIKNRMISLARRQHGFVDFSAEDELNEALDAGALEDDPSELLLNRERERELDRRIRANLSPLEYEVYDLYVDGAAPRQISETLNVSSKTVENALYRMRLKLQKLLQK